jgi:hypothetical protein
MIRPTFRLGLFAIVIAAVFAGTAAASGLPVIGSHPRLLLTPSITSRLMTRKNSNDPAWIALAARADTLATYTIFPYKYATRTSEPDNTIFYDYQGSGWFDAVMPLALAWRMTGKTTYLNKLLAVADEMVRAQYDPANNPPNGRPPLEPDDYYPTRYLGYVIGIIFDWCHDQLGATRKAQLITLMNAYFDDMRANAYQANSNADGNYFGGHLMCAAAMGYASYGDNPRAQEMIDYARIRFDGTPGKVAPADVPDSHFSQLFEGGYKPEVALDYLGPNITGAPFLSGFDFQGWAYGTGDFIRLIDYLLMVRSATGEDLLTGHLSWFTKILSAEKQALLPNHFEIDPNGDWGGFQGAVIPRELPARLAAVLAGTASGSAAQHFASAEIANSTYPDVTVWPLSEWENFFFGDPSRPSAPAVLAPFYSAFGPAYPKGGATNGAVPYFIMRSDWGAGAVWASVRMGAEFYDDHQHYDAGTMAIKRGNDYLLVDASNWKGPAGSNGILGDSTEALGAASKNTLYFNDFGDYMYTDENYVGGQGAWGIDRVVAAEQNANYSYVRGDLSTAYNRAADPADQVNRKLDFFYRNFLYLPGSGIFVIYDQVRAKPSANPRGPYAKHLRWHLPNKPSVSGHVVSVSQGTSRLYLQALEPLDAQFRIIDESNNPDPCDDGPPGCVPYLYEDAGTFRVEVRDPLNPLFVPFLTVLQPAAMFTPPASAVNVASSDGKMAGARIVQSSGKTDVVLFNNQSGQVPAPITSTQYGFSGSTAGFHTLAGMIPGARYKVAFGGGLVQVAQNASGNFSASPAGVVRFRIADLTPTPTPSRTTTPRPTSTKTPTPRPTPTRTPTPRPTATRTHSPRPTGTRTPTPRPTATHTATPRPTATRTP